MPHSMPYSSQSNKWFSVLIIVTLPFLIIFKWAKNDLPHLTNHSQKKADED